MLKETKKSGYSKPVLKITYCFNVDMLQQSNGDIVAEDFEIFKWF